MAAPVKNPLVSTISATAAMSSAVPIRRAGLDADRAAKFWSDHGAMFAAARRYQNGTDAPEHDDTLPLAWRRDEHLRRVYAGTEPPGIDLERLSVRVILGAPSNEGGS